MIEQPISLNVLYSDRTAEVVECEGLPQALEALETILRHTDFKGERQVDDWAIRPGPLGFFSPPEDGWGWVDTPFEAFKAGGPIRVQVSNHVGFVTFRGYGGHMEVGAEYFGVVRCYAIDAFDTLTNDAYCMLEIRKLVYGEQNDVPSQRGTVDP